MKATNTLVSQQGNKPKNFAAYINGESVKNGIIARLNGDVQAASRLISTITAAVNASPKLQDCDYSSIVSAALTGEVGMNLSYALGQYGIIPYGNVAKYQLQVNGLKQLCIRSRAYSKIDCFDVREGEFAGRDPLTREPIFHWIEDEDERLNKPIVGYYAFYMLNDANNRFFQSLYWSHEKILRHADRYSPGFKLDKYRALLAGELPPEEVIKLQGTKDRKGSSPWYANPDDDPHMKMCMKTVLKQLLNDGLAPKSIQEAIYEDDATESDSGVVQNYNVDEKTGEVISVQEDTAENAPQDAQEAPAAADVSSAAQPAKRGRRPKETNENANMEAQPQVMTAVNATSDDAVDSFFDGGAM